MFRPLGNDSLVKVMLRNLMNLKGCPWQTAFGTRILDDFGDKARPTGLMRCADATAGIAIKVLEKEDVIAEIRIVVHFAVQ